MQTNHTDHDVISSEISYDGASGSFTWKRARKGRKNFKQPGSLMSNGYRAIRIFGKDYLAHRIAWLLSYGSWPLGVIDHKNGVRSDNRLTNLRDVSQVENMQNVAVAKANNKSGFRGVSLHKRSGKYQARIKVGEKYLHIGLFNTASEANEAYMQAKKTMHSCYRTIPRAENLPAEVEA